MSQNRNTTINRSDDDKHLLEATLSGNQQPISQISVIPRRPDRETAPLSFAQQRLWFLQLLQPASPFYNVFHILHFPVAINVLILKRALAEVVKRHEILRTEFMIVNTEPVQKIKTSYELPFREIDLRSAPALQKESELNRIASAEAGLPFDLTGGELARVTFIYLEPNQSVLLFSIHHIIIDGWSIQLLNKELLTIYEAFSSGKPSPLPELTVQYADYAVWQREWLSGNVRETHLNFWKTQLAHLPVLQLPTAMSRLHVQSYCGQVKNFNVPKPLYARLKKLSSQQECTLFITLLSAFNILLFKYTAQEDIAVGCPVSGRTMTELESLIGFFVNTVVLRSQINGRQPFNEVLQHVKEISLNAFAHQDIPFEIIVKELQPSRDISRNPLFQVVFQLLTGGLSDPLPKKIPEVEVKVGTSKFDLTLSMIEKGGELTGSFEFNTDLFLSQTIERMTGHYLTLLQSIVDHPKALISDLEILSIHEKQQLLVDWNNNTKAYPDDQLVHLLIGRKAKELAGHLAIYTDNDQLTYSELDGKANQFARYLAGKGVGAESMVAVCMHRSIQMVVVHLAILKAGGAFVPLDPAYPKARLAFMLEDTQASFVITEQQLVSQVPDLGIRQILIDQDRCEIETLTAHDLEIFLLPQNRCYVMYTSGSTGKPKGVELSHTGLLNLVHWSMDFYAITTKDRCLQMAIPAYDAYIFELFPALAAGASVYLVDDITRTSSSLLTDKLIERGITIAFLPTAMTETILKGSQLADLPLRMLATGGEKLIHIPVKKPPFELINFYGPTETTVIASYCAALFGNGYEYPPIGRPVANVQLYVLDQYLNPVPIGVPGELYVGGAGLGRGYFNRAKLTAERFIPDPFSNEAGSRLFKTGDLVRYLSNGDLDFIGRIDHQVKLRGFRIELNEIEKVISENKDVKEAAVTCRQKKNGDKAIFAYVAPQAMRTLTEDVLKSFLKEKLPAFMLPSYFIFLDELPKSLNGKIDRKALPDPDSNASANEYEYPSAETPLEKMISCIWKELLTLDNINVEQNFFDMGGHSLMMAQVHYRLKENLNTAVSLTDLFQYPTIRSLSKHLEKLPPNLTPLREKNDRASKQRQAFLHQKLHNKKNHNADGISHKQ